MTRLVLQGLAEAKTAQKAAWDAMSWGGGIARAEDLRDALRELRTRADAYAALADMTVEDVCGWLGIEPDDER